MTSARYVIQIHGADEIKIFTESFGRFSDAWAFAYAKFKDLKWPLMHQGPEECFIGQEVTSAGVMYFKVAALDYRVVLEPSASSGNKIGPLKTMYGMIVRLEWTNDSVEDDFDTFEKRYEAFCASEMAHTDAS